MEIVAAETHFRVRSTQYVVKRKTDLSGCVLRTAYSLGAAPRVVDKINALAIFSVKHHAPKTQGHSTGEKLFHGIEHAARRFENHS
jgi:hypothetical protein